MGTLAAAADERVADVTFSDDTLTVRLMDGRAISVPLAWYPRLLRATPAQRAKWRISGGGYGIHWPDVDEDLSTEGLLRGAPAPRTVEGRNPGHSGAPSRKVVVAPLLFESLNETDIREEVIAPLLLRLGYKSGSTNDVIREQSLRYPKLSLGRKDPRKDPELRGKADYILDVDQRVRWVFEAKAPTAAIGTDDIEQAWTYANHPEVRAVYFAICNGRSFSIYRTDHGPQAKAVLSLSYEKLDEDFQVLENLLGPDALLRDFPKTQLDIGIPIAPGLRSIARITNGVISYEKSSFAIPVLKELQVGIVEGAIEHDERGGLVAFMKTRVPSRSLQELNERLGLASFEMTSEARSLSPNTENPTIFTYANQVILPAGERIFDLTTWRHTKLPSNIACNIGAKATGAYRNRVFSGIFSTSLRYLEMGLAVDVSGTFEAYLA